MTEQLRRCAKVEEESLRLVTAKDEKEHLLLTTCPLRKTKLFYNIDSLSEIAKEVFSLSKPKD